MLATTICFAIALSATTACAQDHSESGNPAPTPTYSILNRSDPAPHNTGIVPVDHLPITPELNQFLTELVLESIPHQYTNDKKWGKQEKRFSGIDFRRDSDRGRLETKRRYKMVNHGTWRKYSATLIDPRQHFSIELAEVSRLPDGQTFFQVNFTSRLKIEARQAKWAKGVQLYSISAHGKAAVRLQIDCELEIGIDVNSMPPDLVLQPKVTDAKIHVDEFRIDRVSKLGGEFAQQVSKLARAELEERIEEKEQKLVQKTNDKISKKQDELRISVADALKSKWYQRTANLLPDPNPDAVGDSDHR